MIQRKTIVRLTVLAIAGLLALVAYLFSLLVGTTTPEQVFRQLAVGEISYNVLLADTPELHTKGLSGHPGLQEDEGMLFVFEGSQERSFWMKDMNFPIDIIWISEDQEVVGYVENVDPSTYPESFGSKVPVRYVLEVNAFDVKKKGIEIGDIVALD